jgi:hypothetical protein
LILQGLGCAFSFFLFGIQLGLQKIETIAAPSWVMQGNDARTHSGEAFHSGFVSMSK